MTLSEVQSPMNPLPQEFPGEVEIRNLLQSAMAECTLRRLQRFFFCLVPEPARALLWCERLQVALQLSLARAPFADSRALICWTFMQAHQLWLQASPPSRTAACAFCRALGQEGGLTEAERALVLSCPHRFRSRLRRCATPGRCATQALPLRQVSG